MCSFPAVISFLSASEIYSEPSMKPRIQPKGFERAPIVVAKALYIKLKTKDEIFDKKIDLFIRLTSLSPNHYVANLLIPLPINGTAIAASV